MIIREDILPAIGITVAEAATLLGIAPTVLLSVVNGKTAISPGIALRIERWLGIECGGSAAIWLSQQAAYDQWKARRLGPKE